MKIKHFKRINNMESFKTIELFVCSLTHKRIHMNRIDSLSIWILFHHTTYCAKHPMHGFAQILTTVCSN